MIEDPCSDEAGQLMNEMHKIQTWTKAKRAIYITTWLNCLKKINTSTLEGILINTIYQ